MVLETGVPVVGLKVTLTASLPRRVTLRCREAVPARLTVLDAEPTVLEPSLAVAESLPLPVTLTVTFTPARLVEELTLTESDAVFGASTVVVGAGVDLGAGTTDVVVGA